MTHDMALDLRATREVELRTATVASREGAQIRLLGGAVAKLGASCLLQPEPGDLVLVAQAAQAFVVSVLQRVPHSTACELGVAGVERLALAAPEIAIHAERRLCLSALLECEVTAAAGVLRLNAQNLAMTVADSIVEVADEVITQAKVITHRAEELLSTLAKRQLWVAEKEMRVDAETIQMG